MALLVLLQNLQRLHHAMTWHGDHGWHQGSAVIATELQSWCQQRPDAAGGSGGTGQHQQQASPAIGATANCNSGPNNWGLMW